MADESIISEKKTRNWRNICLGIGFSLIGILFCLILFLHIEGTTNIFLLITNFTVCLLLMNTGSKLLRKEKIQKEIIACTIPSIIFISFTMIGSSILEIIDDITIITTFPTWRESSFISMTISIAIIIFLGSWDFLLFVYLREPDNNFSGTNIDIKLHTSKILSYLSPGFGKIFVGKGWKKYSLFIIYILLQTVSSMFGIERSGKIPFGLSETALSIIGKSSIWIVFRVIDSYYIYKYEKSMKTGPLISDGI